MELIGGGTTAGTHNDLVDVAGSATIDDGALVHVTPENGTDTGRTGYSDGAIYTVLQPGSGLSVNGYRRLCLPGFPH